MVYNHQVIAYAIEGILVAPREPGDDVGDGLTMFIEHLVSKFLQAFHFALVAREANLEFSDRAKSQRPRFLSRCARLCGAEMSAQPIRRQTDILRLASFGGSRFEIGQPVDLHQVSLASESDIFHAVPAYCNSKSAQTFHLCRLSRQYGAQIGSIDEVALQVPVTVYVGFPRRGQGIDGSAGTVSAVCVFTVDDGGTRSVCECTGPGAGKCECGPIVV